MTRARSFMICLMALGGLSLLNPSTATAQVQGVAPPAANGQAPAAGLVAAQPMYYYPVPMAGAVYAPGYVYLPRRAYRHSRIYVAPAAVYQLQVAGPPGIAPSWSTLRAGLDRYPLYGGVVTGPVLAPAVPGAYVAQPGDAPLVQPVPDPIGASPPAEVPPPAPAPDLRR
jgi:hypothetical protein